MKTRTFGIILAFAGAVTLFWEGFHGAGARSALGQEVISGAIFIFMFGIFLVSRSFGAQFAVQSKSPVERTFIKLFALWAILLGLGVNIIAAMVIHEDHLLTISMWGHHGFRELVLAFGCSVLGISLMGLGLAAFRYLLSPRPVHSGS